MTVFSYSWAQVGSADYARVKIAADQQELNALGELGVAIDHVEKVAGGIIGEFSSWELQQIRSLGLSNDILIPDVAAYYAARNDAATAGSRSAAAQNVPNGFNLGTMGGHLTYDETVRELDSLQMMYPTLVTPMDSIGRSIEGRAIWMLKISNAPGVNETDPEVLYVGLHHAREPMSVMNLVYFMHYLLENYGSDPEITYLINHRELYFIPILNPDGYVYNETTNPNGGGMWRKNRRGNGTTVYGVDLNRNYDYGWAHDNIGSSYDPVAPTFRGQMAFSEPETQAIEQFCAQHQIRTALNYHAWGEAMVNPWGFDRYAPLADIEQYHRYGGILTEDNDYLVGNPYQTLGYAANGTSDDWMYGDVTAKPQIMAFTPEIGDANDWFWPVAPRIVPLCEAQIETNLRIAHLAGPCVNVRSETACEREGAIVRLPIRFANFGLEGTLGFTAQLSSGDPNITGIPVAQIIVPPMAAGQEVVDSFSVALATNIPRGTRIHGLVRTLLPHNIVLTDTIQFTYGVPELIFSEDGEGNLSNWGGSWSNTDEKAYSGTFSITDSPYGLYSPSTNSGCFLQVPLDLTEYTDVSLRFRSTWELERDWDYVEIHASQDGVAYYPLSGNYTQPGVGGHQPSGEPVYDGSEYEWVLEKIDLSAYDGQNLYLQFGFSSNGNQHRDGFYFDDLEIRGFRTITGGPGENPLQRLHLYPNPGTGHFQIAGHFPGITPVELQVHSLAGKELLRLPLDQGQRIDLSHLAAGVYLYAFSSATSRSPIQKLVIR